MLKFFLKIALIACVAMLAIDLVNCQGYGGRNDDDDDYDRHRQPKNWPRQGESNDRQLIKNSFELVEKLYECVKQVIIRAWEVNVSFPKACCFLPVFRKICQANRNLVLGPHDGGIIADDSDYEL